MVVDFDLNFVVRDASSSVTTGDFDLSFGIRPPPVPYLVNFDLNFAIDFDANQSLVLAKVGDGLATVPLLFLVGGTLVDPLSGEEWTP